MEPLTILARGQMHILESGFNFNVYAPHVWGSNCISAESSSTKLVFDLPPCLSVYYSARFYRNIYNIAAAPGCNHMKLFFKKGIIKTQHIYNASMHACIYTRASILCSQSTCNLCVQSTEVNFLDGNNRSTHS